MCVRTQTIGGLKEKEKKELWAGRWQGTTRPVREEELCMRVLTELRSSLSSSSCNAAIAHFEEWTFQCFHLK